MPKFRHLRPDQYRAKPWKNHRGMTTEIAIFPESADHHTDPFLWRLSAAQISSSSSFSLFPGYDRTIVLLDAGEMELNHDFAEKPVPIRRLDPYSFKGEWSTMCEIGSEAATDFNLMVRRGKAKGELEVRSLQGAPALEPGKSLWTVLFCAEGRAEASLGETVQALETRETWIVERAPGEPHRGISLKPVGGPATVIVVRIDPLQQS